MVYLAYAILLVVLTAIERTWPGWLLIHDQGPALIVAAVVSAGLCGGPVAGCFGGLVGALLLGSIEGAWIGGAFFAFMALGTAVGLLRGSLLAQRAPMAALVTLIAVPVVQIIRLLFSAPPSPAPGSSIRVKGRSHGAWRCPSLQSARVIGRRGLHNVPMVASGL